MMGLKSFLAAAALVLFVQGCGDSNGDKKADSGADTTPAQCGDGVISGTEQCDGSELGGATCEEQGFTSGALACAADCTFDTSGCETCGDNTISGSEICDGSDLGGETCESQGFDGGTLGCQSDCTLDITECFTCGDGVVNGSEACDGSALGGQTCGTQGFDGGILACNLDCTFNTANCEKCGDGQVSGGEECEGSDVGNETCESQGFEGGTLGCQSDCTFDTTACFSCGDDILNGDEDCDGADVGSETCETQGFDSGTLACNSDCTFDTASCFLCGDGVRNGTEDCEGSDVGGETCGTQGFDGGALACTAGCTFSFAGCYVCGDGILNGSEDCDDLELDSETCESQGYDGGTLACTAGCTFDTAGCYKCGDGVRTGPEECEGNDVGGQTCESQGYDGGTLACTASCTLDPAACFSCGDGTINGSEECDGSALGGETCASQGFDAGSLGCKAADCTFDTAGCVAHQWVDLAADSFASGAPWPEPCRQLNEVPHTVTLTEPYRIMTHEVTQKQFEAVSGYNLSHHGPDGQGTACGDDCPVENVTWHEAAAYCNALSAARGLPLCYSCVDGGSPDVTCSPSPLYHGSLGGEIYHCPGFRLPTESEWEMAYRAGTEFALYSGTISTCDGSDGNAELIAWYLANAGITPHPVGMKQQNQWGLYDMAGNVWEWCHDWYEADLGTLPATNPSGPPTGTLRVVRGGSFSSDPGDLRAAVRNGVSPQNAFIDAGFRCAQLDLPVYDAPFALDFEGGDCAGLSATGDWECGVINFSPSVTCGSSYTPPISAHSGQAMWGTKLNDCYTPIGNNLSSSGGSCENVYPYDDSILRLLIRIPADWTSAKLTYWSWEDFRSGGDWIQVRVNGTVVSQLCPVIYSPPTGWIQRTIDLSAHIGGAADVAFHFMASSTTNLAGWYIDDISVAE